MPLRRGELDAADIRLGEGVVGGVAVGSELVWSRPGIMAYAEPDGLVFREGVQAMPSTFTRASQAWDGSGLVAPDTMRVFGRDTKSPVVLIEGQRTNLFLNSGTPAEQTFTGTGEHTISMHGTGSLQLSGDSTATVTEGNPVTVTLSDTLTVSPVGNVQWGQVEEAPFPSSYIPTDGAPATRAGDMWQVTLGNANQGDFTLHTAWVATPAEAGTAGLFHARTLPESGDGLRAIWGSTALALTWRQNNSTLDSLTVPRSVLPDGQGFHALSATRSGENMRIYVDGDFMGDFACETLPIVDVALATYYHSSGTPQPLVTWKPFVPGASALGIPLIDNRAWSAEEIQAAHARWLPELEKIEVPV